MDFKKLLSKQYFDDAINNLRDLKKYVRIGDLEAKLYEQIGNMFHYQTKALYKILDVLEEHEKKLKDLERKKRQD